MSSDRTGTAETHPTCGPARRSAPTRDPRRRPSPVRRPWIQPHEHPRHRRGGRGVVADRVRQHRVEARHRCPPQRPHRRRGRHRHHRRRRDQLGDPDQSSRCRPRSPVRSWSTAATSSAPSSPARPPNPTWARARQGHRRHVEGARRSSPRSNSSRPPRLRHRRRGRRHPQRDVRCLLRAPAPSTPTAGPSRQSRPGSPPPTAPCCSAAREQHRVPRRRPHPTPAAAGLPGQQPAVDGERDAVT